MERRPAFIRKSDLAPAFEAAKEAGFDHVSVMVELADGKRLLIFAGTGADQSPPDITPLERWRANRAAS